MDVKIEPDSVIYCDPPYKGTSGYVTGDFDYSTFYDWCRKQTEPLFISEYTMPDDFVCVGEMMRQDSQSATNNSLKAHEKLFIPKHQQDDYYKSRITLF